MYPSISAFATDPLGVNKIIEFDVIKKENVDINKDFEDDLAEIHPDYSDSWINKKQTSPIF